MRVFKTIIVLLIGCLLVCGLALADAPCGSIQKAEAKKNVTKMTFAMKAYSKETVKSLVELMKEDKGVLGVKPDKAKSEIHITFDPGVTKPEVVTGYAKKANENMKLVSEETVPYDPKGCGACPSRSRCPSAMAAEKAAAKTD